MMMRALCLVLVLSDAAAATSLPRIGVAPTLVEGDPRERADTLADDLADAVARGLAGGAVDVVEAAEVRGIAARAARSGLVCDARDAACAARLAAFSGLDFIVVTRADVGDHLDVTLTLIDGHDGATLRERRAPVDDVATGVEAIAAALMKNATVPGRLEVRGPQGAAVDVDGVVRGTAPLTCEPGAGLHTVNGRIVRVPAAGLAVVDGAPGGDVTGGDVTVGLAVTAAVGFSVALSAGIGAAVVAPDPADRDDFTARGWNDAVATGQALVAVAAVGGAVAILGGGLWAASTWVGASENPR